MSMDYREYILDHYRNPRNYGKLEHPDAHAEDFNPLCGDQLAIDLQIAGDQVMAVRFQGRGCAISQAAASMLSEMIEGKTVEEVVQLGKDDVLDALGIPISHAGQVGIALASAFAREGAMLAISSRTAGRVNARAEELRAEGAQVVAVPADLTTEEGADAVVLETMKYYGRINILVNLA